MTAELVVMNSEGVALAADSAITLQSAKIFDTGNKLFMLAPTHSVGILIFNNPAFMLLPFEIILKSYRDDILNNKKRFEKLQEYGYDFINYLKINLNDFSTESQQIYYVKETLNSLFLEIVKEIWKRLESQYFNKAEEIPNSEVKQISNTVIKEYYTNLNKHKKAFSPSEEKTFISDFQKNFVEIQNEISCFYFEKLPISNESREMLKKISLFPFIKKELPPDNYSGIVFAGYGDKDLLPKCISFRVDNLLCNRIKCYKDNEVNIEFTGNSAAMVPFAQHDIVENLISGRHPKYFEILNNELINMVSKKKKKQIIENVEKRIEKEYTGSILTIVNALSKDDLAIIAETIVSMTSFMRKVSMSIETVGGPVDVAVISKKDGFIWIKRKHYFDIKYNQHFDPFYGKRGVI